MTKKKGPGSEQERHAPDSVGDIVEYQRFAGDMAQLLIVKIVAPGESLTPEEVDKYYPRNYQAKYPEAAAEELQATRYIGEFLAQPGTYMVMYENNFRPGNERNVKVIHRMKEAS